MIHLIKLKHVIVKMDQKMILVEQLNQVEVVNLVINGYMHVLNVQVNS